MLLFQTKNNVKPCLRKREQYHYNVRRPMNMIVSKMATRKKLNHMHSDENEDPLGGIDRTFLR